MCEYARRHAPLPLRQIRTVILMFVCLLLLFPGLAAAQSLQGFLEEAEPSELIPGADRFGAVQEDPPGAAVYEGDDRVGYAVLNTDYSRAIGYSSKPLHILVGVDEEGIIRGSKLVQHDEPIVLIGIPEQKIRDFLDQFNGFDATQGTETEQSVDIVSGATVTVLVMEDSVLWAANQVARRLGLGGLEAAGPADTGPSRDIDRDQPVEVKDWATLQEEGAIASREITVAEVNEAFEAMEDHPEAAERPESGPPEDTFIELHTGLVSIPSVGRSLLGERRWANLQEQLEEGEEAIFVAGRGRYSFKGSGYVRGGIFDRIEMSHSGGTTRFHDYHHTRLGQLAAEGAPEFDEVSVFTVPADAQFDPVQPWKLALLVQRETGALSKVFTRFTVAYEPPEHYLTDPPPEPEPEAQAGGAGPAAGPGDGERRLAAGGGATPDRAAGLWKRAWENKTVPIAILAVLLAVVTVIFFFQTWLARRPTLLKWTRYGVLAFVLVWLGWWSNAQLSVVNIFTLTNSVLTGFSWSYFLMDPLVFILWAATAAAMIFWARGAFCGWLCPFGALQELTNHIAQRLGVKQIRVPFEVHERLWPIKYILFLLLFGLALYDLALAERFAEVEPFKTAIILNFVRDWPYVVYALVLLFIGLFIERFFCRYLCPLGAALAIPARLRTFEWLKRWPECGTQCHRCARECPVQSIHPEGHINVNECIYCLHCQELYFDDHRCPHNVTRRLKRERRRALGRRGKQGDSGADTGGEGSSGGAAVHKVGGEGPRSSKQDDPTQENG
ncbi:4Fe-4S binding protein [Arhodomonas sp. SL1]|uniref:4Fe-4S binding protein n=1 Tax=Arhodomonas sp. SL1 TaxID=3425691 RepID=UPI003F88078E